EKLPARILAERRAAAEALLADPVIYQHVIQPILKERCVYCHGPDKQEGDYRMDSYAAMLNAGKSATGLVPGSVEESAIVSRLHLPSTDKHHMPPADKPQPTLEEIALIEWWIDQGAPEHKQRSELVVTAEAETALASLVSPAERKAREEEQKRREEEAHRQLVADRQDIRPVWRAFEEAYPGALTFVSATTMEMRFNGISYLEAAGDDALDLLAPFADHLVEANFTLANLADDAAARLARFTSLRRLNLSQTAVTDAFLENLAGLANLESLNLYGTQVTPAVLASLQRLPALNTLYIGETAIDAAQAVAVRDQLAADRAAPVTVIGADQKPDLALLSEDGVFRHKLGADQARYGMVIGSRADLTLSSADPRHHPRGRLPLFIADEPNELDFVFHTR
ncbi:MAG TPA: c-type cytochrome domain-containing protein, partial [Afifellaceae bacterium]|nr:c-type cytochrome domain-containing protein [Afifellaceae bacterium]